MSRSLAHSSAVSQDQPRDRQDGERSQPCDPDLFVDLFNEAIEQSSWKNKTEALAKAMDIDRAYLSRIRSKDKPLQKHHIEALPDDVEAIFARLYAESFGLVVVVPSVGRDAVRDLVAGLIGVLSPLPEKSSGQLKASLSGDRRTSDRRE